jgi:hypothetical protein
VSAPSGVLPFFAKVSMTARATVVKVDSDRRLVFGWANIAVTKSGEVVVDSHNEQIHPDELENAAYNFVLGFRDMNADHTAPVLGQLVESMMFNAEKCVALGLNPDAVDTGWWVGFYVEDDEAWEKIKKNEYSMFSIEGSAIPLEVE